MTTNILYVKSSVFGDSGVSSQLSEKVLSKLTARHAHAQVRVRDLSQEPLPHFSANYVTALSTAVADRDAKQQQLVAVGDKIIAEVKEADVLVVTAPMYNFNVPSTLKAWFDYLARPNETFRYTAEGPEGLLTGKKVYVVTTRGGLHKGQSSDIEVPFLEVFLNFLGLTDIEFIYAEGLNMSAREQGIAQAEQQIAGLSV